MVPYCIVNFVIFREFITRNDYYTLYGFFWTIEWCRKAFIYLGYYLAPIAFMFHHFLFFFFANILGVISFYNYYFAHFIAFIFITVTIQRGANRYIKGISARLDLQLENLKKLERHMSESN